MYTTVWRYVLFAKLVLKYPRLIVSELSFRQIIKYHKEIQKYLETDIELAEALKLHVTIYAQNRFLDITAVDMDSVPSTNVPPVLDPDYVYEDDSWYPDNTFNNDNWSEDSGDSDK